MDKPVFVKNLRAWSGDLRCTDARVVPGIFPVNRRVPTAPASRPYHVRDVATTVLTWFGLDTSDLDGDPLPLS